MAAAFAGFATTSARAALVDYTWVPDTTDFPGSSNPEMYTSGSLVFNTATGTVSSFIFYDVNETVSKSKVTYSAFSKPDTTFTPGQVYSYTTGTWVNANPVQLANGDLVLGANGGFEPIAYSSGGSEPIYSSDGNKAPYTTQWTTPGPTPVIGADESEASYWVSSGNELSVYGDWVQTPPAVPEPTTWISSALLALPFGASTLRIIRRRQLA